jgi:hypothetical protein
MTFPIPFQVLLFFKSSHHSTTSDKSIDENDHVLHVWCYTFLAASHLLKVVGIVSNLSANLQVRKTASYGGESHPSCKACLYPPFFCSCWCVIKNDCICSQQLIDGCNSSCDKHCVPVVHVSTVWTNKKEWFRIRTSHPCDRTKKWGAVTSGPCGLKTLNFLISKKFLEIMKLRNLGTTGSLSDAGSLSAADV